MGKTAREACLLNFHDDDHKVSMRGIPGVTLRVFASEVRHVVKGVSGAKV